MKRRKIDPETKMAAVLEGIREENRWGIAFGPEITQCPVGTELSADAA